MNTDTYSPRHANPRSGLIHYPINRVIEEHVEFERRAKGVSGRRKATPTLDTATANIIAISKCPPLAG